MNLKVFASIVFTFASITVLSMPTFANDVVNGDSYIRSFSCSSYQETRGGDYTFHISVLDKTPGSSSIGKALITWENDDLRASGWTIERRCETIAQRLQRSHEQGALNSLTIGEINNLPVICTTNEKDGDCSEMLFTLRPTDDAQNILSQFRLLLDHRATLPTSVDPESGATTVWLRDAHKLFPRPLSF